MRAFTIRGPLWSSSIFTSCQPWQGNNESYLNQTILGPLPKPFCYGDFFKRWHQWQPTLINTIYLECEKSRLQCTSIVEVKANNSLWTSALAGFMQHYSNFYMGRLGWKMDGENNGIQLLCAWSFVFSLQWEEETLLLHCRSVAYFLDVFMPRVRERAWSRRSILSRGRM